MRDILLVHRKTNRNFSVSSHEAAVWQTCLRQILFCSELQFSAHKTLIEPNDQVLHGEEAFILLLEILCGLHSPLLGETEVLGQFRRFVESRKQLKDPLFDEHQEWLHFVMTEVKKNRTKYLTGLGPQSYGSVLRKHTKSFETITLCGSGQLAQEILPWMINKKNVQVLCRNPQKTDNIEPLKSKFRQNVLTIKSYEDFCLPSEALVIASPIKDEFILAMIGQQNPAPLIVFDLRGEENQLPQFMKKQFSHIKFKNLQHLFGEIEGTKKEVQNKINILKTNIVESVFAFSQKMELRPLGWDDICA